MATKNLTLNLKKDPHSTSAKPDETAQVTDHAGAPKAKKKTGRPKIKEGEYKTINISVPVPLLEKMEVAKLKYGNNLTAYVNAVIKADIDAKFDTYLELQTLINS